MERSLEQWLEVARAGPAVTVAVRKYRGELHVQYPARQVAYRPGKDLALYIAPGTSLDHRGRGLVLKQDRPCVGVFRARHWYNCFGDYRPDGRLDRVYFHVCLPGFVYRSGTLAWVDLELEVVGTPGGPVTVAGRDEFETARRRYNYSAEVVTAAWAAVREAESRLRTSQLPPGMEDLQRFLAMRLADAPAGREGKV